jgi:hypothetical protein
MSTETPRYRIDSTEDVIFHSGVEYKRGAEISTNRWPRADLTPLNEAAERVKAYWARYQAQSFFPEAPWTAERGFYLPAVLPRYHPPRKTHPADPDGSELVTAVPAADAPAGMPLYRVKSAFQGLLRRIGNRTESPQYSERSVR